MAREAAQVGGHGQAAAGHASVLADDRRERALGRIARGQPADVARLAAQRAERDVRVQAALVDGAVGRVVEARPAGHHVRAERERAGGEAADKHEGDRQPRRRRPGADRCGGVPTCRHRGARPRNGPATRRVTAGNGEAVAHAPDRLDQARRCGVGLDLRPQPLDGDIDEARVAQVVVAPDPLEQLLTAEHLAPVAGERQQQLELRGREAQIAAVAAGLKAGRVDLDAPGRKRGRLRLARSPPQDGPNTRDQLGHLERLRDVVVRAELEPDHHVDGLRPRRQHHDGHTARTAQLAEHLEPVDRRQHHVEQDDVVGRPPELGERLPPVADACDPHPRLAQADADHLPDGGVVLDQEHPLVHAAQGYLGPAVGRMRE